MREAAETRSYRFFCDAKEYRTARSSMTAEEILNFVNAPQGFNPMVLFMEREGSDLQLNYNDRVEFLKDGQEKVHLYTAPQFITGA